MGPTLGCACVEGEYAERLYNDLHLPSADAAGHCVAFICYDEMRSLLTICSLLTPPAAAHSVTRTLASWQVRLSFR